MVQVSEFKDDESWPRKHLPCSQDWEGVAVVPKNTQLSLVSCASEDKGWHLSVSLLLLCCYFPKMNGKWSGKKLTGTSAFVHFCCFSWSKTNGQRTTQVSKSRISGYLFFPRNEEFWRVKAFRYFVHALLHITPYCQLQNNSDTILSVNNALSTVGWEGRDQTQRQEPNPQKTAGDQRNSFLIVL